MKRMFYFEVFKSHLLKIYRSFLYKMTIDLLYWNVYDIIIYEKSYYSKAITVKLCFIETRLKQGYDLLGYFLKITRETLTIGVIY